MVGQLLTLWERGPTELGLLAGADATVGERDAALLDLRESLFGPRLEILATCPGCGEQLEADVQCADLRRAAPDPETRLEAGGATFRLPTSGDLAAAGGAA